MIIFISDLHLDNPQADSARYFTQFIEKYRHRIEKLYILGDLFDVWIGDDIATPIATFVSQHLSDLSTLGVPCFVMPGNRDFLLGKAYAEQAGFTLLSDPTLIDIYGTPCLLMHGDTLCLDDPRYLAYRDKVHNPVLQRRFLALPRWLRASVAKLLRQLSQLSNRHKTAEIMDVTARAVENVFQSHPTNVLIHGHTHRPKIHRLTIETRHCQRIVLGAWHANGNGLICTPDGKMELKVF